MRLKFTPLCLRTRAALIRPGAKLDASSIPDSLRTHWFGWTLNFLMSAALAAYKERIRHMLGKYQ